MKIERLDNVEDAKICDELLTKLFHSERKFYDNIREDYVVKEWFEKVYNKKNNAIFVAKCDKKIVGYIYCRVDSIENGPTIELEALIDGLYVDEEFRKQGIATALLDMAKQWAKEMNVKYLFLNVFEKNENAMNLYYKNCFEDCEKKLRFKVF